MFAKVVHIACVLIMLFHLTLKAQLTVNISDELNFTENGRLKPMTFAFFDEGKHWFYLDITWKEAVPPGTRRHVVYEVKKKSQDRTKIKPLLFKDQWCADNQCLQILDSLPIGTSLYSGNFECLVSVSDQNETLLQQQVIPFQVFNLKVAPKPSEIVEPAEVSKGDVDIRQTFVVRYSLEQLKSNIRALLPIARDGEGAAIKGVEVNMDTVLLQRFFYEFWLSRDATNPEKAWKAYAEKLNYVAKTFGTGNIKGYETDQGRIYLSYGIPSRIERVPSEKNARPYQIWFYYTADNGRNNVKFLFMQPGMMARHYILLHSSEKDEIDNPQWKQYLLLSDQQNDKANKLKHRVFEYFQ